MLTSFIEIIKVLTLGIIASVIANILTNWIFKRRKTEPEPATQKLTLYDFLRSLIVVLYYMVAYYFINTRWVASIIEFVLILAFSVPILVGFEYLYFIVREQLGKRIKPSIYRELFYLGIVLSVPLIMCDSIFPHYVDFNCPIIVDGNEIIEGKVVNPDWKVQPIIHPILLGKWYLQNQAIPDQQGNWLVNLNFGGGSGDRFEVAVLTSPSSIDFNGNTQIDLGEIPSNVFISKILLVRKQ